MIRRRHFSAGLCLCLCLTQAPTLAAQDPPSPPPDISDGEKLNGLSLVWQEANYNFAFFDQVSDLNWDSDCRAFVWTKRGHGM